LALAAALFAAPLAAQELPPTAHTPAAPVPVAVSDAPAPAPTLVDEVIKLWKANLSEDFLKKYVATADVARDLSAEDIVRLRNAGLPEGTILSINERKQTLAGTSSVPAPTVAGATATTGRWDGLARRNGGMVMFKSRWDSGVLEFKDQTLRWTDAKDTTKNLFVPVKAITEQQLTCEKKAGGNDCFEWVVKTKSEEYRFRDVAWEQGATAQGQDVYRFFKALYPNLVSSQLPVDGK
jgi:hypothetical protein